MSNNSISVNNSHPNNNSTDHVMEGLSIKRSETLHISDPEKNGKSGNRANCRLFCCGFLFGLISTILILAVTLYVFDYMGTIVLDSPYAPWRGNRQSLYNRTGKEYHHRQSESEPLSTLPEIGSSVQPDYLDSISRSYVIPERLNSTHDNISKSLNTSQPIQETPTNRTFLIAGDLLINSGNEIDDPDTALASPDFNGTLSSEHDDDDSEENPDEHLNPIESYAFDEKESTESLQTRRDGKKIDLSQRSTTPATLTTVPMNVTAFSNNNASAFATDKKSVGDAISRPNDGNVTEAYGVTMMSGKIFNISTEFNDGLLSINNQTTLSTLSTLSTSLASERVPVTTTETPSSVPLITIGFIENVDNVTSLPKLASTALPSTVNITSLTVDNGSSIVTTERESIINDTTQSSVKPDNLTKIEPANESIGTTLLSTIFSTESTTVKVPTTEKNSMLTKFNEPLTTEISPNIKSSTSTETIASSLLTTPITSTTTTATFVVKEVNESTIASTLSTTKATTTTPVAAAATTTTTTTTEAGSTRITTPNLFSVKLGEIGLTEKTNESFLQSTTINGYVDHLNTKTTLNLTSTNGVPYNQTDFPTINITAAATTTTTTTTTAMPTTTQNWPSPVDNTTDTYETSSESPFNGTLSNNTSSLTETGNNETSLGLSSIDKLEITVKPVERSTTELNASSMPIQLNDSVNQTLISMKTNNESETVNSSINVTVNVLGNSTNETETWSNGDSLKSDANVTILLDHNQTNLTLLGDNSTLVTNETANIQIEPGLAANLTNGNGNETLIGNMTSIETTASPLECNSKQVQCYISETHEACLPIDVICDGFRDCFDGSDEANCTETCGVNFRCGNESSVVCVGRKYHCDGLWDCADGSDESTCHFENCPNQFSCNDKSACLLPIQVCDGKHDCRDHSDEKDCVDHSTCSSVGKFFCDNICIEYSLRCDGLPDCADGSDESNCTCTSDEFKCWNGDCIDKSFRCDGQAHCRDESDEWSCVKTDQNDVLSVINPATGNWALVCADNANFTDSDGDAVCQSMGLESAINITQAPIKSAGNVEWVTIVNGSNVTSIESCNSSLVLIVTCQTFTCSMATSASDITSSSSSSSSSTSLSSSSQSNSSSASSSPSESISNNNVNNGPSNRPTRASSPNEIQSMLIVKSNRSEVTYQCLAQIISPIWLLTSAECLRQFAYDEPLIVMINSSQSIGRVARRILHPHNSKFRYLHIRDFDLALIGLNNPLHLSSGPLSSICLPENDVASDITCFMSVIGESEARPYLIQDRSLCNDRRHFNLSLNHRQICASPSYESASQATVPKPGSNLVCLSSTGWFLGGFVSFVSNRTSYAKHPSVFSNVFTMRDFISTIVANHLYRSKIEVPYNYTFDLSLAVNETDLVNGTDSTFQANVTAADAFVDNSTITHDNLSNPVVNNVTTSIDSHFNLSTMNIGAGYEANGTLPINSDNNTINETIIKTNVMSNLTTDHSNGTLSVSSDNYQLNNTRSRNFNGRSMDLSAIKAETNSTEDSSQLNITSSTESPTTLTTLATSVTSEHTTIPTESTMLTILANISSESTTTEPELAGVTTMLTETSSESSSTPSSSQSTIITTTSSLNETMIDDSSSSNLPNNLTNFNSR